MRRLSTRLTPVRGVRSVRAQGIRRIRAAYADFASLVKFHRFWNRLLGPELRKNQLLVRAVHHSDHLKNSRRDPVMVQGLARIFPVLQSRTKLVRARIVGVTQRVSPGRINTTTTILSRRFRMATTNQLTKLMHAGRAICRRAAALRRSGTRA